MAKRRSGDPRLEQKLAFEIFGVLERAGDGLHHRRQKAVGLAHHRVLFMDGRGDAAAHRSQYRGERRITAEAYDGGRHRLAHDPVRRLEAVAEHAERLVASMGERPLKVAAATL